MRLRNRIIIGIIFIVCGSATIEITDYSIWLYNKYKIYGRIPPKYTKDQKIDDKKEIKKFFLKDSNIISLYQMMKDVDDLFAKNNIKYFIEGGILLGAVRNHGIIAYDDDLDISVFEEDGEKIKSLEKDINKLGYTLFIKYPDWYVINSKYFAMDVFHRKKIGSIYKYSAKSAARAWSRFFFLEKELFPLKKYQFGEIEIYGPNDPSGYLRRGYGEDYMQYGIYSGGHFSRGLKKTLKVEISEMPELQVPAKPTGPLQDRVKK